MCPVDDTNISSGLKQPERCSRHGKAPRQDKQIGLLLRCAPGAIAATKRLLAFVDRHDADENFEYTVRSAAEMWSSAEAAEGMKSFIEKRKPGWAV